MHDNAFKIMHNVWTINHGKVMQGVVEYKHAWIMDCFFYGFNAYFFIGKPCSDNVCFFMQDVAFKIMYDVWTINRVKVMHIVMEYKHAWILD